MTRVAAISIMLACPIAAAGAADWPQAAANAARTAHVADQPNDPYTVAWTRHWDREVLTNTSQPIMANGVALVGSTNGFVHAVELATGDDLWTAEVGASICHALACDAERVYAAAMDGAIYALDRRTGARRWTAKLSRRGFSAAPLLLEAGIFVGNRDGVFYGVNAEDGKPLWQTDTGAPIVQTAAGADGRIVFVNEGMRALCLDAESGDVLWATQALPGRTVRDYWPVIYEGRVIVRTAEAGARVLSGGVQPLQKKLFWPVSYGPVQDQEVLFKAQSVQDVLAEQDIFVEFYRANPRIRTFIALSLADGTEPYTASVVTGCRNTGVPPPPVVAGDGGLYTTFRTSAASRGIIDITDCGIGRFDVETGKIAEPLICGQKDVGKVVGAQAPFELTSDETVTLSSGGSLIFGYRCDNNGGVVDVVTRQGTRLPAVELPRSSDMLPSGNVLAISGKYICYTKFSHVVCIRGQ